MQKEFQDVQIKFSQLKRKFQKGKISNQEFKDQLKKLRLNDKKGRCWTIGARTGKWYYFNGRDWIESKPPTLQEGKAICIYCGFENDLENVACDYCGGNMGGGDYSCPRCGVKLNSPTQNCPECGYDENSDQKAEIKSEDVYSGQKTDEDEGESPRESEPADLTGLKFAKLDSQIGKEENVLADDGGPNFVLRSLNPNSLFLFLGITGSILGIIAGGFVGASSFFPDIIGRLPIFLQSLQGKLLGGIIYGLLGGLGGFMLFGIFGYVNAVLINLIFSFFGGIKIRLDQH